MEDIRLYWQDRKIVQFMLSVMADSYEDGAYVAIRDRENITFNYNTTGIELFDVEVSTHNKEGGLVDRIFLNKEFESIPLDQSKYGVRAQAMCGPLWSDNDTDVLGVWILITPRINQVYKSFDYFAPILTEALPEGGVLYLTDREKSIKKQSSNKFDVPNAKLGHKLKDGDIALECIKKGQTITKEIPRSVWGKEILISCYPLHDNTNEEIIGSFGLAMPRELPFKLKLMSNNLGKGLSDVSVAMEEMSASASEVSQSQNLLNRELGNVQLNANEINNVLIFIKEIADQTKMLGLNAAIEAARAGDNGRGFGVVAEEIRKLSDESKQTVIQIKNLLEKVHESIAKTKKVSDSVVSTTEQVAAATEEINASIQEMTGLSEQLDLTATEL